ncbi:MAG: NAD(P)/FAD-dependent oxidoreductase [Chloroflexi bacterium]|nr:NAD(P)/FAD-dependent oxidoreductase [Chloroflexota bacterium]
MRIGIIGAGALGLTAALRIAERGHDVVVFEREDNLGGLVASFAVGKSQLERFYHHIFRSDRAIQRLIDELGLGDRLLWLRPRSGILWDGRRHRVDSPPDILRFPPLSLIDRLRFAAALAYLKLEPDHRRFEGITADAWVRRWTGPEVYRVFWRPQLESKFGDRREQIAMPWLWSRVHERSTRLGYIRGGFAQIYDRLGEQIERRRGRVEIRCAVTAISRTGDRIAVETDRGGEQFDRVVAAVPTRVFIRLAAGLPDAYRAQYDWGEAFGAHCAILALDRPLTDMYWLSVNDPGYPFMVLVEHTNLMPADDYGGQHLVYLGNYLPVTHPRFSQPDAELLAEYYRHLPRINPAFDPSWVRQSWVFRAPFAQPIVTTDYPRHIPPLDTPIPGVFLANMFQVYPQDRGQNYSILLAERVAARVLADFDGVR